MIAYLGIDSGATQMRSVLVDAKGHILAQSKEGPGNILQVDFVRICQRVKRLIQATLDGTSEVIDQLTITIGLAGSGNEEGAAKGMQLINFLEAQFSQARFILKNDAEIALTSAHLGKSGIVLIAGTGSICLARDRNGKIHRTGGWGSLLDDAGSGAWIGRRGLHAAAQQADGRVHGSELKQNIFKELGVESIEDLLARHARSPLDHTTVASLCPCVLAAEAAGDLEAIVVIDEALDELVKLIRTTARKSAEHRVALTGGIFLSLYNLHARLKERLQKAAPDIRVVKNSLRPEFGAVIEGYLENNSELAPEFLKALRESN